MKYKWRIVISHAIHNYYINKNYSSHYRNTCNPQSYYTLVSVGCNPDMIRVRMPTYSSYYGCYETSKCTRHFLYGTAARLLEIILYKKRIFISYVIYNNSQHLLHDRMSYHTWDTSTDSRITSCMVQTVWYAHHDDPSCSNCYGLKTQP